MSFLSWHLDDANRLFAIKQNERLPHALLITGLEGIGKKHFAEQFSSLLLCRSLISDAKACGRCHDCQLLLAGNHPDLKFILPEGKAKEIKIDQIRRLDDFIGQTATLGGSRVIIIDQAERMNLNAANAVLKMLEEPGRDTYFFLLTSKRLLLLPTIQSRCQLVSISAPSEDISKQYLIAQNEFDSQFIEEMLTVYPNQPLFISYLSNSKLLEPMINLEKQLLSFLKGQIALAEIVLDDRLFEQQNFVFEILHRIFQKALKESMLKQNGDISSSAHGKPLLEHLQGYSVTSLLLVIEQIQKAKNALAKTNLNKQLLVESLFFESKKILQS